MCMVYCGLHEDLCLWVPGKKMGAGKVGAHMHDRVGLLISLLLQDVFAAFLFSFHQPFT